MKQDKEIEIPNPGREVEIRIAVDNERSSGKQVVLRRSSDLETALNDSLNSANAAVFVSSRIVNASLRQGERDHAMLNAELVMLLHLISETKDKLVTAVSAFNGRDCQKDLGTITT